MDMDASPHLHPTIGVFDFGNPEYLASRPHGSYLKPDTWLLAIESYQ
jgi:hypothetical protein